MEIHASHDLFFDRRDAVLAAMRQFLRSPPPKAAGPGAVCSAVAAERAGPPNPRRMRVHQGPALVGATAPARPRAHALAHRVGRSRKRRTIHAGPLECCYLPLIRTLEHVRPLRRAEEAPSDVRR